jgi:hypothetical protein
MLRVGDRVNIETDMIVRTVVHQLNIVAQGSGITVERLREVGFS